MKKKIALLSTMLIAMVVLAGCNLPAATMSAGDSQTQVALFAQATLTKFAQLMTVTPPPAEETAEVTQEQPTESLPTAEATATEVPPTATQIPPTATTAVPPTATTQPLETEGGMVRVSFEPGTTNYTVVDTIPANTTRRYALRLTEWQLIDISLDSTTSAFIAVSNEKGKEMVDFSQKWTWYRDFATEAGDWYIDVRTGAYEADINLYLQAPERLSFGADQDSMVADALVPANRAHNFVAWGDKDQTLKVSLNPSEGLVLSIWHTNGNVLISSMAGANSFEGKLPEAGNYIITVFNSTNQAVEFDLSMSIK